MIVQISIQKGNKAGSVRVKQHHHHYAHQPCKNSCQSHLRTFNQLTNQPTAVDKDLTAQNFISNSSPLRWLSGSSVILRTVDRGFEMKMNLRAFNVDCQQQILYHHAARI